MIPPGTFTEVAPGETTPVSVTALNAMARDLLEAHLPLMWVSGEISNFIRAASGHCYFVLKDAQAQVRCTLFRHRTQYLEVLPKNGDRVDVRASPSLYEARGEFQLNVEYVRLGGMGRLYEAFEKLKAKLREQGWFDPENKRPLPAFACTVGVVTSAAGAALRDVLTTLRRRMPSIQVIIYPTLVQGQGAAQAIAQAIALASVRAECDVLIVCRGGGSIEDLWAFNEEIVASAIRACVIPVVSGVGHETDTTIADFVADARAATPTAAAQLVSQDRLEWLSRLEALRKAWHRSMERQIENRIQRVDFLSRRMVHPGARLTAQRENVSAQRERLRQAMARRLERDDWRLADLRRRWQVGGPDISQLQARLRHVSFALGSAMDRHRRTLSARLEPLGAKLHAMDAKRVLQRGYSIVWDAAGKVVLASSDIGPDTVLNIQFGQGRAEAIVTKTD